MTTITLPHPLARTAAPSIEDLAKRLQDLSNRIRRFVSAYRYRHTLKHMPNWALRDIGIAREDIANEVDNRLDKAGRSRGGFPF